MLWSIFAFLTAIAVISALWPLAKAPRARARRDIDVALYRAQIAEIERDEALRALAPDEASYAKAEVARRLLARDTAADSPPAALQSRARLAALAVLIFVPAMSLALYTATGHPELPDAPLAARQDSGRVDLAAAIAKVEAHLALHPDDGRGYEVLAPVYLRLGRTSEAVNAARSALRLLGETPTRQALYAETLLVAANGVVTPEARQLLEAAVKQDPTATKPRFFLGLAAEQRGDRDEARDIWSKLLDDAPQNAPWAPVLRERIASLGQGPEEAQDGLAAKIEAMPDGPQASAIRAMVDGLAARLAKNGHDLEGWLRLVRSYTVLHEPGKARTALVDAKRNLAGDPAAIARIEALARELGLES